MSPVGGTAPSASPPASRSAAGCGTGAVAGDDPAEDWPMALFRLLHEPGDLDCIMAWLNPEESDRKSLASFIRRLAPEATLTAIARNAFGTIFWEDLDAQKLRWLLGQVKKRAEKWRGRARPTAELVQGPF